MSEVKADTRLAKVVHIVGVSSPSSAAQVLEAFRRAEGGPFSPTEIVINRGSRDGVKLGDKFLVFAIGPHIVDPDTGKDLGELEIVRGRGEVVHVQDQVSTLRTMERSRTRPPKRIIRDGFGGFAFPGKVIEEELAPEAEVPFEAVRLGDLAKPI